MPSLPTSLIFVGLVVAWLVVLVPMVAKRREYVPDHEDEGESFRVLEPRAARTRRRPVWSRTVAGIDAADDAAGEIAGGMAGAAGDFEVERRDSDGDGAWDESERDRDRRDADRRVRARDGGDASDDGARGEAGDDTGDDESAQVGDDAREREARVERATTGTRVTVASGAGRTIYDASLGVTGSRPDDVRAADERAAEADADLHRPVPVPVPVRPGRGGFDPAASDRLRLQRYRQRRTVTLVLAAVALIGAGLAALGVAGAGIASVSGAVLLVLYLAYLRRQVHIEREIRARRMARLHRARQIRPSYRASVAQQLHAHRTGAIARPDLPIEDEDVHYQVRSHARPSVPGRYHLAGTPVAYDDDDPAFDDLDYYQPVTYRRAAGQ